MKGRQGSTQGRLDNFFKVLAPTGSAKRKVSLLQRNSCFHGNETRKEGGQNWALLTVMTLCNNCMPQITSMLAR